ncbi:MAG: hypothetical protein NC452_21345 [Eubacterium sp.]|nr:hypothetical protein [Eubacterium sp.]
MSLINHRGKLELLVRTNGVLLPAKRGLDDAEIAIGEKVDVFLYRIFVTAGDKAYLLENRAMSENSVFI